MGHKSSGIGVKKRVLSDRGIRNQRDFSDFLKHFTAFFSFKCSETHQPKTGVTMTRTQTMIAAIAVSMTILMGHASAHRNGNKHKKKGHNVQIQNKKGHHNHHQAQHGNHNRIHGSIRVCNWHPPRNWHRLGFSHPHWRFDVRFMTTCQWGHGFPCKVCWNHG